MNKLHILLAFSILLITTKAQDSKLKSGPMLGYNEMREASIWLQTNQPATVWAEYYNDSLKLKHKTDPVVTQKSTAFTAHLLADSVLPGTKYTYQIFIDGKKLSFNYDLSFTTLPLWQHRSDAPDFSFALGSCFYANEPAFDRTEKAYGGGYGIFKEIDKQRPNFMLWLGDNTYLREPDWNTRAGIWHRYAHTRAITELQSLLAHSHHYAIWDDHDYGPNDSDRSFHGKKLTLEAFKLFWSNLNYGVGGTEGITGTFEWNDCQFFLLDNRWYRSQPKMADSSKQMLGKEQISWLMEALKNSKASFKFIAVGGQILNPLPIFENYAVYKQERDSLMNLIFENKIKNVVFLSGDRHFTELSMIERGKNKIYDLTISPLTSSPFEHVTEKNYLRVPGTICEERNFGLIRVSGTKKDRKLELNIYNEKGEVRWNKIIEK
jgi:alkaline phosphatase D